MLGSPYTVLFECEVSWLERIVSFDPRAAEKKSAGRRRSEKEENFPAERGKDTDEMISSRVIDVKVARMEVLTANIICCAFLKPFCELSLAEQPWT